VLGATVIRFFNCIGMGVKVKGTDTYYCYRERKYQGAKVPPMVLSFLGAKVRGNENSIILARLPETAQFIPMMGWQNLLAKFVCLQICTSIASSNPARNMDREVASM